MKDELRSGKRIFLGRIEEQKRFRSALDELLTGAEEELPMVALIHGEGGMGKTMLSRRYQDIVSREKEYSSKFHVLSIDWEDERKKMPELQVGRELIQPEAVFRAIHAAAIRKKWGRHFRTYNKSLNATREAERKVAELLTSNDGIDELAILRHAGVQAVAKLVRWRVPLIGDMGEELVEQVTEPLMSMGIRVAKDQLPMMANRVQMYLKARLKPNHFDFFLNPNEQLAHSLAKGLISIAKNKRLIIFMDSYEIVDRTDIWIRSIMREAGDRVMWVIGGRNHLIQSRQFGNEYFKGYADDWPRRLLDITMWPLSVHDISDYFKSQGRHLSDQEIEALSRVTKGRPLAIHEAADMLAAGASLKEVIGDMSFSMGSDQIIHRMTERYLQHVVNDADLQVMYALALADGDVEILRDMIAPPDKRKTFNLDVLLRRLERGLLDGRRGQRHSLRRPGRVCAGISQSRYPPL